MTKFLFNAMVCGIAVLCVAGTSDATLVTFDTTGTIGNFGGGDTSLAASTFDSDIEATPTLAFGPGLPTGNDGTGSFSTHGWATTAAASFAGDDYLTWTVDATAGNAVNLSDVSFQYNAQENKDVEWALFSSKTGLAVFGDAIDSGTVVAADVEFGNSVKLVSVDLSAVTALQGVEDSIEFRLVLTNGVNAFSRSGVRGADALTVDGTVVAVAVPEPSSFIMLSLVSGLGALTYSRRKRS